MKAFGTRLEVVSAMVPAGGWVSALLPVLALVGLAAAVGDYGAPGLEKAIVGLGDRKSTRLNSSHRHSFP